MNLIGAERHTQRGVLMRRFLWLAVVVAAGIGVLTLGACLGSGAWSGTWTSVFPTEPDELVPTGRNPYFILEPGYYQILEKGDTRIVITVLTETKMIDGGPGRAAIGTGVSKSRQKWNAQQSAVRSIAWLGLGVLIV